jgi:hypothetical protein
MMLTLNGILEFGLNALEGSVRGSFLPAALASPSLA